MKKKKFLSLAMACVMACSLATTAFAASDPTLDIKASYNEGASADKVVSYSYAWDKDLSFTYSTGSKGTWNPETHTYSGGSQNGSWTANGSTEVKVTNHSNCAVKCNFSYAPAAGFEDITVGATDQGQTIASAEGTAYDSAPSHTFNLGIVKGDGDTMPALPSETADNTVIGTVTLVVRAA